MQGFLRLKLHYSIKTGKEMRVNKNENESELGKTAESKMT